MTNQIKIFTQQELIQSLINKYETITNLLTQYKGNMNIDMAFEIAMLISEASYQYQEDILKLSEEQFSNYNEEIYKQAEELLNEKEDIQDKLKPVLPSKPFSLSKNL